MSHASDTMFSLSKEGTFERWVPVDDPWVPNLALYIGFGSLPDKDNQSGKPYMRKVRCSNLLSSFILTHTTYKHPVGGTPEPERALQHLLRCCFVNEHLMFKGANSPSRLLCNSCMVLDMAFIRAVFLASQWVGESMPAGRIQQWPPPRDAAGL